ncbi:tRNA methyltransferase, partial [Sinorhizobium meliloti]
MRPIGGIDGHHNHSHDQSFGKRMNDLRIALY